MKSRAVRRWPAREKSGAALAFGCTAPMRYAHRMKTAALPSVRVETEFLDALQSVLTDGETLASFVEASVRSSVKRRYMQAEFIAGGLRSRDEARRTGDCVSADAVADGLQRKLDAARARVARSPK